MDRARRSFYIAMEAPYRHRMDYQLHGWPESHPKCYVAPVSITHRVCSRTGRCGMDGAPGTWRTHRGQADLGGKDVYGVFAVVIGLLSWLYLGAQIAVLAAELNVVLRKGLWPRSLIPPPHRPEDDRAMRLQAQEEEADPRERVSVEFRDGPV